MGKRTTFRQEAWLIYFGGHVGMILLVLFILFQYSFQIIRSLCQDDCEADVGIVLRSRCQSECDADVKMNVLHYVFPFCELGGDLFHELCQRACDADVMIMRSRCQGECEATVKSNAKPMSHRARSRCREGTHTRTRRMEVHTHTNKLMPNGNTQSDMFYLCLH